MAKVKAALLDKERRIYLGIVEVDEDEFGPEHLPQITECDLPPHQYRWEVIQGNPMGGQFVPLPPQQRAVAGSTTLEQAVAYDFLARRDRGEQLPDVTLAYLDGLIMSFDFKADQSPLVTEYRQARGLLPKE